MDTEEEDKKEDKGTVSVNPKKEGKGPKDTPKAPTAGDKGTVLLS